MSPSADRITALEARIAELERARSRPMPHLPRLGRRLAILVLAAALMVPAGAVLASHQFSDVPTSHQFHNSIDAIADAGITAGCGGGRYCPNGLVTRGQMAAFLNRLGALTPGSAPKVNADRVDGRHANQFIRVAEMEEGGFETVVDPFIQYGDDLVLAAPTEGLVFVTASVRLSGSLCSDGACTVETWINHIGSGAESMHVAAVVQLGDGITAVPVQGVFTVAAGQNSFELIAAPGANVDDVFVTGVNLTAIFIPFGSTGGSSL